MQSSLLDFCDPTEADGRVIQAGFLQENEDGSYSTYTCRWSPIETRKVAGRSAYRYLQTCFSDRNGMTGHFTSSKLRCHHLASLIPTTPLIARRFARESPVICHVNRHTHKQIITDAFDEELALDFCDPKISNNHMRMQLQAFSLKRFVALEVPLYSHLITGHLDCLICDDERDMLYALEIKSYPSDHTDPFAGTARSILFRNLVQALAYGELLAHNTSCGRVGVGLLHSHGMILLDAQGWLRAGRTLMKGVSNYLGRVEPRHRTSRICPSGPSVC